MWPAYQSAEENASMQGKDFEKTNLHNVNIIFSQRADVSS
jgi:hypothetical protein